MRCLILGGDGYLGWSTAMHLSQSGANVVVVDNYSRRQIARDYGIPPLFETPQLEQRCKIWREKSGLNIEFMVGDAQNFEFLSTVIREFQPEAIIHYAEQRSAPFSMKGFDEARLTLFNNLTTTFNLIWAVKNEAPDAHIIKLGTMGEYGTPNIDIEEGWLDVTHNGRLERFLYPRSAGSLYHTSKILDTDLLYFYVRNSRLRVTDIMQGPVYGLVTRENAGCNELLPVFDYDDIFGTVVNRFVVQAIAGMPLSVYGIGEQTRGFINLRDSLQAIKIVADNPAQPGELRILNQFTEQLTINQVADKVVKAAAIRDIPAQIAHVPNPRGEKETHYYQANHQRLFDMGFQPELLTEQALVEMIDIVKQYHGRIDKSQIMPRFQWVQNETPACLMPAIASLSPIG